MDFEEAMNHGHTSSAFCGDCKIARTVLEVEVRRLRAEKEKPMPEDIHVRNCQCQAWPPAVVSDLRCVSLRAERKPEPRAVERLWERTRETIEVYPTKDGAFGWARLMDLRHLHDQSRALDELVRAIRGHGPYFHNDTEAALRKAERALECGGEET